MSPAFRARVAYAVNRFVAFSITGFSNGELTHPNSPQKAKGNVRNAPHLTLVAEKKDGEQGEQNETKAPARANEWFFTMTENGISSCEALKSHRKESLLARISSNTYGESN